MGVCVRSAVGVDDADEPGLSVGVAVPVPVPVPVCVFEALTPCDAERLGVGVFECVGSGVCVAELLGVPVRVGELLGVPVCDGVPVWLAEGPDVGVRVFD